MWSTKAERDAVEVRRILAGDRERFGVLVERYLPGVWAVASAHLGNPADAEEATQEAFVQAYASLPELRDPQSFGGWLLAIARNASRGMLRQRRRETPFNEEFPNGEPSPQPDIAAEDTRRVVRAHVDRLESDHREVLMLHYFGGLSSREMSRVLGVSAAGARKRLQRARTALSASMTNELQELRPDAKRFQERKDVITKAVLATGAGWSAAATASSAVASASAWSLFPSAKLLTGAAVGIVATIGLGWYIAQQAAETPTQAQFEPALLAEQISDTAADDPAGSSDNQRPAPVEPTVAQEPDLAATEAEVTQHEEVALEYTTPEGIWHARLEEYKPGKQSARILHGEAQLRMQEDALILEYFDLDLGLPEASPELAFMGSLQEGKALLKWMGDAWPQKNLSSVGRALGNTTSHPGSGVPGVHMSGSFNREFTIFQGATDITSTGAHISLYLTRLTPSELVLHDMAILAKKETESAARALGQWNKRNGGWPDDEEAKRVYEAEFSDPAIERSITYRVPRDIGLEQSEFTWRNLEVGKPTFRPDLPLADRLMSYEVYLTDKWGDAFPDGPPLLEIEYPEYELTALAISTDKVELRGYMERAVQWASDDLIESENRALRGQCQNQLKQLGLAMKMFMSESSDELCPPGWRTLHPEFMPDLSVLRCPTQDVGTLSYEIVFPAANRAYYFAVYDEITGTPAPERGTTPNTIGSRIPMAFETHDCEVLSDGEPRRNVIYVDGHVSALSSEEFEETIAPYLAYK